MKLICASIVVMAAMQQPGIETIARDSMSGVDRPRQAVARTDGEWSALWQQHAGSKPLPKVDFTKRTVVAVFLGSRPSAGYSVELTRTRQEGKTLIVEWREVPPGRDSLVAQVITSPALLVSLPKFDGEITFEKAAK
jgi:hypothetical protein